MAPEIRKKNITKVKLVKIRRCIRNVLDDSLASLHRRKVLHLFNYCLIDNVSMLIIFNWLSYIEEQGCTGRNHVSGPALAVGQVSGHHQVSLLARTHVQ